MRKKSVIKICALVLMALLLSMILCSCGESLTKSGSRIDVKVKGLNTKTVSVVIKGDFAETDTLDISIPEYEIIEETEDGHFISNYTPFFETVKSANKKGVVTCKFEALTMGNCTLVIKLLDEIGYKDVLVKLDLVSDENLKISCNSIYLDEQSAHSEYETDDGCAVFEIDDNDTVHLCIFGVSNDLRVEGYDANLFEIGDMDTYISGGLNGIDIEVKALAEGSGSIIVVDNTLSKRYIAGLSITKDSINEDIGEFYIMTLDSIESEVIETSLNSVWESKGGFELNEYKS